MTPAFPHRLSSYLEAARAYIAFFDFVENVDAYDDRAVLALAPEAAEIAGASRRLGCCQFVDYIVGAAAHFGIAGLLPGQHQRRHIMAHRMPREDRKSVV